MTGPADVAADFFERYAAALLARDATDVAGLYAVPSLILFPGRSVLVTDAAQTAEFFAASWTRYEGVHTADPRLRILEQASHTLWVDVTWSYDGQPRERFCYQLLAGADGYQIVVLTPMDLLDDAGRA